MNWAAAAAVASLSMVSPGFGAPPPELALNKAQLLLQAVAPQPAAGFLVEAWADSPDGAYSIGEAVRLFIRGSRDAYYTVLTVGPSGDVLQLYPPADEVPLLVRAGEVLSIPGQDNLVSIRAAYPAGRELIRIVGSLAPLSILPGARGAADLAAAELQAAMLRLPDGLAMTDIYLTTIADAPCRCVGR